MYAGLGQGLGTGLVGPRCPEGFVRLHRLDRVHGHRQRHLQPPRRLR
jgi:hypothetical protein